MSQCLLLSHKLSSHLSFHMKRSIKKCILLFRFSGTLSSPKSMNTNDLQKIRNIGIIAHIDAGKTTTTERMLYYSGLTNLMGEVHDGNTVMDYMPLERERGITISSAAITFFWKKHKINLIDTPGHVDFTFEVERSLAVLEGAVVILDSSAGVEVQTLKVWNQAKRYKVPCIVYLNKMDKPTSDIDMCLTSLVNKLKIQPLLLHIPIGLGKKFTGVIDILKLKKVLWKDMSPNDDGSNFINEDLSLDKDREMYHLAVGKREKLIESIADMDDIIAEKYICHGSESLNNEELEAALYRITAKGLAVPVLCGSSYKNMCVQLLMDAVLTYLPAPTERMKHLGCAEKDLFAYAFKIIHNKQKEPLTFLRLYSGSLKMGQKIYNSNRDCNEKIHKLTVAYADDFKEVPSVTSGNIAVVSGLKDVFTGDLLFSSASVANTVKSALKKNKENYENFSIDVPNPVFFCTIEPPSVGFQKRLDSALLCLQREDPTFRVEFDEALGQTIIMGMGELHIDVIKERIKTEYDIEAYLGPLLVAYREAIEEEIVFTHVLDKVIAGTKNYVKIMFKLYPVNETETFKEVKVIVTKENDLGKIRLDYLKAINSGIKNALNNGPLISFPVIGLGVNLMWFETTKSTSHSVISAAASQCVTAALKKSKIHLLEPVMNLSIIVDKGYAGKVLNDLSQKRSQILNMEVRQDVEIIESLTPLSELKGYSSNLRAITSGTCSFTMEFDSYKKLDLHEQARAIQEITGFA